MRSETTTVSQSNPDWLVGSVVADAEDDDAFSARQPFSAAALVGDRNSASFTTTLIVQFSARSTRIFSARPTAECWSEIWDILRPLIETRFNGGPATWMEDIQLELNRYGFTEETHFTIAYSPVPDETVASGIGGVLATVHEISEKVVGEKDVPFALLYLFDDDAKQLRLAGTRSLVRSRWSRGV